jgi:hypothetical protein
MIERLDPYNYVGILYPCVLLGALLLLVVALIMRRWDAQGSKLSGVQRAIAGLAVVGAVIPGVWLLTSDALRGDNGLTVCIDLLIPVSLTLVSAMAGSSRRTLYTAGCALVLGIFCLLGGASIGPLYLPAAALLVLAGAVGLASPRTVERRVAAAGADL